MSADSIIDPQQREDFLLTPAVALALGVTVARVAQLRESGELPFVNEHWTGRPLHRRQDVLALIEARNAKRAARTLSCAERDAEILKLHRAGHSGRKISRLLGHDTATIYGVIAKASRS